ncbi:MAG: SUMF1/EgtB/PvdO family nonheme iron enzyme, partial [Planctomycetota bacterium]
MAGNVSDEAFARVASEVGAVTFDLLEAARQAQAEAAQKGARVAHADVLIRQGVISPIQRATIEKRVQAQQAGGLQQLGPYKLLKKLGEGGMGAVYLADDTNVGRKVAVKVLPKKYSDEHEFLTRFRREAQATGKLNHPNIVVAYNVGEDAGTHYYAMEYCDGETLDRVLKSRQSLPWDSGLEITTQVARGLKHAHDHGVIHRDIKPANIFICAPLGSAGVPPATTDAGGTPALPDGFVAKILDLGLSKNISGKEESFYTQTGVALGTPHYISPEQAKGDKGIDGRTDIYSLGATLYHLVTGQTPFSGTTAALIMMKHINEQLPNPQDICEDLPDGVVQVIQKMMAKEPADRYANCKELLEDLELVIDGKMPSSQAIDVGKSSVAVARVPRASSPLVPSRDRKGVPIPRDLPHARGSESPRAARRQPVPHSAGLRKLQFGKMQYISIGAVVLGALILVVGLLLNSGRDKQGHQADSTALSPSIPSTKTETDRTAAVPPGPVFLSDLPEEDVVVSEWHGHRYFGKNGRDNDGKELILGGVATPKGILLAPPGDGYSHAAYRLNGKYTRILGKAGICGNAGQCLNPVVFKIIGDGKALWESTPRQKRGDGESFEVDMTGVAKLELVVHCPGRADEAMALWFEPRLLPVQGAAPVKELSLDLGGGVKMDFVLVPAGEFMMGEKGVAEPVHPVKISKPFYMGKYHVTVAQFRVFADATKSLTEAENAGDAWTWKDGKPQHVMGANWKAPGFPQQDNCPACVITWNDAQAFCKWASALPLPLPPPARGGGRLTVRLPTEAEWEYACRAGTTTRYNTGDKDSDLEQAAWFDKNSGGHTNACGQRKPNAWGLYDMHGNLWEWVQDYLNDKYYAESPPVDPKGPANGG